MLLDRGRRSSRRAGAAAVAVGDCGCTGGIFGESYACRGRVANVIPVDVSIPGCPPTPLQLMQGILAAIAPAR